MMITCGSVKDSGLHIKINGTTKFLNNVEFGNKFYIFPTMIEMSVSYEIVNIKFEQIERNRLVCFCVFVLECVINQGFLLHIIFCGKLFYELRLNCI